MITRIGIVAGEILTMIEEKRGPVSLAELLIRLDEPKDLIKMSLGWMVREGLIVVNEKNGLFTLKNSYIADSDNVNYAVNI